MKLKIHTENINLDAWLEELVQEKLNQHLEKYLKDFSGDIKIAKVNIEKRKRWGYAVSFDMWLPGRKHIFAKAKDRKLANALVQLREELETEIKRYKDKLASRIAF